MYALVTDAHLRNAVAGMRGLGRAGVKVIALAPRRGAAGLLSRYATSTAVAPDEALAPTIKRLAAAHGPLVVYPGTEMAIDALLDARAELPSEALLPYGNLEALRLLRDKRALPELAAGSGLRAPQTFGETTAGRLLDERLPAGCIVKPPHSGGKLHSAHVIRSRLELDTLVRTLPPEEPLLVQELVAGQLVSLELVLGPDGELCASFQQLVRRIWPPLAGKSTLASSVPVDSRLLENALQLLSGVGYSGLIQLQVIDSGADEVVIDLNPRFYGPLPLSQACGVNLPAIWHASVVGDPPPAPSGYPVGVTYRRVEADVHAARAGSPRRLLSRGPAPRTGAMWASDDPLPGAVLGAEVLLETMPLGLRLWELAGRAVSARLPTNGSQR